MLVITRRQGESFYLGNDIKIVILGTGSTARIGIAAPDHIEVVREELLSDHETDLAESANHHK